MEYLDKDNQIARFKCDKPTYLLEQILKYSDDFFDSPYNVKRILLPGEHSDANMKSLIFILDDIFMTFFNIYKNNLNNKNQYKSIPNYVLTKMIDNDYNNRPNITEIKITCSIVNQTPHLLHYHDNVI